MQSLGFEEETIFYLRNLFRQEKETKAITDRILRDINDILGHEEEKENYYKSMSVGYFRNNNYIEHESYGDRNKTISAEEYLNKIRPYLKNIINNLKKSDTWKIQLAKTNNFMSSIDNDQERVLNSKNDNIEIIINDEADKVIKYVFDSLKKKISK